MIEQETILLVRYQMFFATIPVGFGILHFVLYLYNRQLKEQLYYALFLLLIALGTFFDYQSTIFATDRESHLFLLRIHRLLVTLSPLLFIRFIYSVFYAVLPGRFWFYTSLLILTGTLSIYDPQELFRYHVLTTTLIMLDAFVVITKGLRTRKGAGIIAAGFTLFVAFNMYDVLLDLEIMLPLFGVNNAYMWGQLGFYIAMSVFLAKDFAESNRKVIEQEKAARLLEAEKKLLESEDRRKSAELESARKLQLSMLPQCVDKIPGLDICFHMEPATEVGGDYYDYHYSADGTLTIGIGDAAGHGMDAGLVVAIMKSLFASNAASSEILPFMSESSRIIREMRLGKLFMAFMMVRITGNRLSVSSAGMPPMYIYRKSTGEVEELLIKGMPLGGPGSYPYELRETDLSEGDAVLLMSDGLAELFSESGEMLDYPRISSLLAESADLSPTEIVRHLCSAGETWRGTRQQDDDITFALIKVQ